MKQWDCLRKMLHRISAAHITLEHLILFKYAMLHVNLPPLFKMSFGR